MHAIAQIPKVLERVQELHGQKNLQDVFREYKKNVKIFIENMKQEISQLIDSYEAVISQLKAENIRLRQPIPSKQFVRTNPSVFSPPKLPQSYSTTIQNTRGLLDTIHTAKSNVFFPEASKRLSPVLRSINNLENSCFSNEINPEGQSFQRQTSRFEVKAQQKKHRQQQIRHYLETGNKSMNYTTKRFMEAVGKGQKDKKYLIQEQAEEVKRKKEQSDSQNDSGLNKSLGMICESLDTSFVSQRARSQRDKRLNKMQQELQKKRKQQEFVQEMMKQKGVKSLLKRLRDNVQSSAKQMVAPIKASKIVNQKEQLNQSKISKRNSKVMINPVPIDIVKKSKVTRKQMSNSPTSPTKKPQSILKNSTILTRSIQGISAIDFTP